MQHVQKAFSFRRRQRLARSASVTARLASLRVNASAVRKVLSFTRAHASCSALRHRSLSSLRSSKSARNAKTTVSVAKET